MRILKGKLIFARSRGFCDSVCLACYFASGDYAGFPGCGLLRLHSTFRHDLKIYASDEGRVQMTAAAFAKVNPTVLPLPQRPVGRETESGGLDGILIQRSLCLVPFGTSENGRSWPFQASSPFRIWGALGWGASQKEKRTDLVLSFQGLLALEGELTPILVQMVKSANMNGLLDSDSDSLSSCQHRVKARLHHILQQDAPFGPEDYHQVTLLSSLCPSYPTTQVLTF